MNVSWSDSLKNLTREQAGDGAMVKHIHGIYGMIVYSSPCKVVINSVKSGQFLPVPTDKKIAEFDSIEKMIEGGWVID